MTAYKRKAKHYNRYLLPAVSSLFFAKSCSLSSSKQETSETMTRQGFLLFGLHVKNNRIVTPTDNVDVHDKKYVRMLTIANYGKGVNIVLWEEILADYVDAILLHNCLISTWSIKNRSSYATIVSIITRYLVIIVKGTTNCLEILYETACKKLNSHMSALIAEKLSSPQYWENITYARNLKVSA